VEAVLLALAAAAGAGALWWTQSRPRRALESMFEPDADVALHVAGHEARSRGQAIASVHLLYGLVQDETITAALRDAGHDPEALEDRTLAALAEIAAHELTLVDEIEHVYGRAVHAAYAHGRKVSCRDLWAYLAGSRASGLVATAGISHVAILFRLCHGTEPAVELTTNADVHVVLRNDDYTTRDFVCEILERVFTFNAADANARMMQTHTSGRAVIGRFSPTEARAKIQEVRDLAREQGYPLWIGVEPT
jgi:ATP-dependent Clp protease adaptor protein ClpS